MRRHEHRDPSLATRNRFLQACERDPTLIDECLELLPATHESLRLVRDIASVRGSEWVDLDFWLLLHDPKRRADLFARASAAPDDPDNKPLLDAVAATRTRAGWNLLGRLAERPTLLRTHAASLLFWYAPDALSQRALGILVERGANAKAPDPVRLVALTALRDADWPEREAWWRARFEDTSIGVSNAREPLIELALLEPDRWIPVLAELAGRPEPEARSHAASILIPVGVKLERADALRPLLPILRSERRVDVAHAHALVRALAEVRVDGSVGPLRQCELTTAVARGFQGDPQAAPELLRMFDRVDWSVLPSVYSCLRASGGLGIDEAAEAVVQLARERVAARARNRERYADPENAEWEVDRAGLELLGHYVVEDPGGFADELGTRLVARLEALEGELAAELRMLAWRIPSKATAQHFARSLAGGALDLPGLLAALGNRDAFCRLGGLPLAAIAAGACQRAGFAQAILGRSSALFGEDTEAQRALLAAARIERIPLQVAAVAPLLETASGKAALLYLLSVDTPESRAAVREHFGEPRLILGEGPPCLRDTEGAIETLVWSTGNQLDSQRTKVRRFTDRIECAWSDAGGRAWVRELQLEEWDTLAHFIRANRIDDLPSLPHQADDGVWYHYRHLTPEGGRQISINNPDSALPQSAVYVKLEAQFAELTRGGSWHIRYDLDDIEPLFASREVGVAAFHLDGEKLYVQIRHHHDRWTEAKHTWHLWSGDGPGPIVPDPRPEEPSAPRIRDEGVDVRIELDAATLWVGRGVWARPRGGERRRLVAGSCDTPLLSGDRRRMIVTVKHPQRRKRALYRIDLDTLTARRVGGHALHGADPLAWIEAHRAFLCADSREEIVEFLVDPDSGETRVVEGEFRPLHWYGLDRLTPSREPGVYWTTLRGSDLRDDGGTWVGLYDTRDFRFKAVRDFPRMLFDLDGIHVDEARNRLHVLYAGHLLRLPLRGGN